MHPFSLTEEEIQQVGGAGRSTNPTTMAIGEEGGGPTTMAIGEEGGGPYTTLALGEEGGLPDNSI